MRVKLSELTIMRVLEAITRRFRYMPHWLLWVFRIGKAKNNAIKLEALNNIHSGERCFILANGPSLTKLDLSLLKGEHLISMNRAYLLYEQLGFTPEFYVCINELVLEQFSKEIACLPQKKFVNWNCRAFFPATSKDLMFLNPSMGFSDRFVPDIQKVIGSGGTVTFACLQLAYYLGFKEVIIVGLDHNFAEKGTPNKTEVRTSDVDQSHFHPNYFPKGFKWQLPDLIRSEMAYALAKSAYEDDGRSIVDATVGGKCNVFKKVDYYQLFK